jgi:pyruvate dehydrogenase E2 component (dihydrolipoamide acetyltransferase)
MMCPIEGEPEFILRHLSPVRKAITERVSRSFHSIPQFDLHMDVDASAIVQARVILKDSGAEIIPTYNDLLIFCTARALATHPELNAHFTSEGIKLYKEINIGFAIGISAGVFLPVIRRASAKSMQEIAREAAALIDSAKNNKLRSSLQMHGTFTISSLGGYGVDSFNAIINPPQVAALAAGTIMKKPWCKDNKILAVDTLHLTLTVDHRAIDGAYAANFMAELRKKIDSLNTKELS